MRCRKRCAVKTLQFDCVGVILRDNADLAGGKLANDAVFAEGRALFTDILCEVAKTIFIPLTVGGGINTPEKAANAARAGADIVVVGNALEKSIDRLQEFADAVHNS